MTDYHNPKPRIKWFRTRPSSTLFVKWDSTHTQVMLVGLMNLPGTLELSGRSAEVMERWARSKEMAEDRLLVRV